MRCAALIQQGHACTLDCDNSFLFLFLSYEAYSGLTNIPQFQISRHSKSEVLTALYHKIKEVVSDSAGLVHVFVAYYLYEP